MTRLFAGALLGALLLFLTLAWAVARESGQATPVAFLGIAGAGVIVLALAYGACVLGLIG